MQIMYVAFQKSGGLFDPIGDIIAEISGGKFCHAELIIKYGTAYRCHLIGGCKIVSGIKYNDCWVIVPLLLDYDKAITWCYADNDQPYNLWDVLAFIPLKLGLVKLTDWMEKLSKRGRNFCSESVAWVCNVSDGPKFSDPLEINPDELYNVLTSSTPYSIMSGSEYERKFGI